MNARKKISSSQVIGSRGEMYVAFLLSHFCLVRHVANGTDVGVDLYCEALIDGVPHSHFWVQVKSRKNRLDRQRRFDEKDLEYWSRQPIPVFVFFVADSKMGFESFQINVINLSEKFVSWNFSETNKTASKPLRADFQLCSMNDIQNFIFNHVPETISRLFIRDGVLFPIRKTTQEEYVKRYKFVNIHKFSSRILKNIGRSSALLLQDILRLSGDTLKTERKQLETILETFAHWGNNDFHAALGLSKKRDEKFEEAILCFQRALRNINSDNRIDEKNARLSRSYLEALISQCKKAIEKK